MECNATPLDGYFFAAYYAPDLYVTAFVCSKETERMGNEISERGGCYLGVNEGEGRWKKCPSKVYIE